MDCPIFIFFFNYLEIDLSTYYWLFAFLKILNMEKYITKITRRYKTKTTLIIIFFNCSC